MTETPMTEANRKAFDAWAGKDGAHSSHIWDAEWAIWQAALTHARGKQEPLEKGVEPTESEELARLRAALNELVIPSLVVKKLPSWARETVRAALAASPAPVAIKPKVKALVWNGASIKNYAATMIGTYSVREDEKGWSWDFCAKETTASVLIRAQSAEQARATAQADYERRILSAIEGGEDE